MYSNAIGLNSYLILKCLAIGGFSKVYLVRSLHDGRFLAMKVMDKRFIFQNEKESVVENEKDICSQLDHPFIVKLEHSFETRNFTYFIMECKQWYDRRLPWRRAVLPAQTGQKDEREGC